MCTILYNDIILYVHIIKNYYDFIGIRNRGARVLKNNARIKYRFQMNWFSNNKCYDNNIMMSATSVKLSKIITQKQQN